MIALDVLGDFRKLLLWRRPTVCETALRVNGRTSARHIRMMRDPLVVVMFGTRMANMRFLFPNEPFYFSLSNEFSNCSNLAWLAATVFASPVNFMNTFPPGFSTIAPSSR